MPALWQEEAEDTEDERKFSYHGGKLMSEGGFSRQPHRFNKNLDSGTLAALPHDHAMQSTATTASDCEGKRHAGALRVHIVT